MTLGKVSGQILDMQYFIEKLAETLPIDQLSIKTILLLLQEEILNDLKDGKEIKISNFISIRVVDFPGQKVKNKKKQVIRTSGHKELVSKMPRDLRQTYHKLIDYEKIEENL